MPSKEQQLGRIIEDIVELRQQAAFSPEQRGRLAAAEDVLVMAHRLETADERIQQTLELARAEHGGGA